MTRSSRHQQSEGGSPGPRPAMAQAFGSPHSGQRAGSGEVATAPG